MEEDEDYIFIPVELLSFPNVSELPDAYPNWEHNEQDKLPKRRPNKKSVKEKEEDEEIGFLKLVTIWAFLMLSLSLSLIIMYG